jgi:serine/threonine protein kinase
MLHSDSKVEFDHEVNTLKRLSFKNHDHLIKLLVTFRLRKRYYLLFPLADANLKDFWQRIPEPLVNEDWAFWISDQCYGIAHGLNVIHHLEESSMGNTVTAPGKVLLTKAERANFGRHGDIKPENILWFQALENKSVGGLGLLKISDFGLTRWHRQSSIGKSDAGMASVSLTYRGPECDTKKTLSPLYDIWTLGCVYIEFVTWYLLGNKSVVVEFPNHRTPNAEHTDDVPQDTYFELYWLNEDAPYESQQVGARVKGAVLEVRRTRRLPTAATSLIRKQWIDQLHTHPNCSQYLHDFLDYIESSLLRVEIEERAPCEQVVAKLHSMYEKCKADSAYCKAGVPMSLAPRPARVPAKSEPSAKKKTHRRIPFSAFTWMKKGDSVSTQHSQSLSDDDDTCPTRPSTGDNARSLLSHLLTHFGVDGTHAGMAVRAVYMAAGLATFGWLAARAVSTAFRFASNGPRSRSPG